MPEFERSVRAWSRGSNFVNLTDEQYGKLKKAPERGGAAQDTLVGNVKKGIRRR
jgi:hypothetical protein